jgi:hypothetical protein
MGKEQLTIEVDADLMQRLRAAGFDPVGHIERLLARDAVARETAEQRATRQAALRAEMQPGLDAYDALIEEVGDWSAGLRVF